MAELQGEKLIEYFKDAISLESDIITQEATREQYNAKMEERKPKLVLQEKETLPERPCAPDTQTGVNITVLLLGVMFLCLGIFLPGAGGFIRLFCLGSGAVLCGMAIKYWLALKEETKAYRNQFANYTDELSAVRDRNLKIADKNRNAELQHSKDLHSWQEFVQDNNTQMNDQKETTLSVLSRLYDLDVIYPKYRNLPALTSIYEYLITGRCDSLTGPHGAYNLYEDEVRKNTVISQLNTVIENLESIRNNQYMLYQQVKQIQYNSSQMLTDMQELKGYAITMTQLTALSAYYTALNERNNRITMLYHL